VEDLNLEDQNRRGNGKKKANEPNKAIPNP
jgi:hypothetical protein